MSSGNDSTNASLLDAAAEGAQRLSRRPWPPIRRLSEKLEVSFEFFPPATPQAHASLWRCIEQLEPFHPAFVSVTYGAGGTTRTRTHRAVERILTDTSLNAAAHLTCVGATRAEVLQVVARYLEAGVNHIVALRGDLADGAATFVPAQDGFADAAELTAAIRRVSDIDISVAAYPEPHPEATSAQACLDHLKRKVDAGATRAITQFCFDPDVFLRFLERARSAGISIPIVPGILPITHFGRTRRFAQRCGASIPSWMPELFEGLDEMPEIGSLVAATVAAEHCRRLAEHGVNQFHFYTLNRAELSAATCILLGVKPAGDAAASHPAQSA
jgi:methylenetetrahydrofolate reductase (NADPH)